MVTPRGRAGTRVLASIVVIILLVAVSVLWLRPGRGPVNIPDNRPAPSTPPREAPTPAPQAVASAPSASTPAEEPSGSQATEATPRAKPSAEPERLLKGRVTSLTTKEPIAGATVAISDIGSLFSDAGELPFSTTKTLEDGTYSIDVSKLPPLDAMMGGYTVAASAERYGAMTAMLMGSPKDSATIDFELPPGGTISGSVVDDAGSGIAASLQVFPGALDNFGENKAAPRTSGKSGANGTFTIDGVADGFEVRVIARAEGYASATSKAVRSGEKDLKLVLKKAGGVINGKVLDATGKTVAGARIAAQPTDIRDFEFPIGEFKMSKSGADGLFTVTSLRPGAWMVMATTAAGTAQANVTIAGDETKDVVLTLPGETTIKGRFVDQDSGKGVAGIKVWGPNRSASEAKITGPDGVFQMSASVYGGGPNSTAVLSLDIPAPWVSAVTPAQLGRMWLSGNQLSLMSIKAGEVNEVDIPVAKGIAVTGIVLKTDETTPVGNANVVWSAEYRSGIVQTGTDGKFSTAVPRDVNVKFSCDNDSGFAVAELTPADLAAAKEIRLVLSRYGSISGTVTGEDGAPVPGIGVTALDTQGSYQTPVMTDEKGYYFHEKIKPGAIRVSVQLNGESKWAPPKERLADVKAESTTTGIDFILTTGDEVTARVVEEATGNPIKGANVSATINGVYNYNSGRQILTDDDGRFAIQGITVDGNVQWLSISHEDYVTETAQNISAYSGDLLFKMTKKPVIKVTTLDRAGRTPIRLVTSEIAATGFGYNSNQFAEETKEGAFEQKIPNFGKQAIVVREVGADGKKTGRVGSAEFTVTKESPQAEVTVLIGEGAKVSGVVVAEEHGKPVADADVSIQSTSSQVWGDQTPAIPSTKTDASGRFEFSGLADGPHSINASKSNLIQLKSVDLTIAEGKVSPADIVIELGAGHRVFGTVTGRDGKPFAGVTIYLYPQFPVGGFPGYQQLSATSGADGAYSVAGIRNGKYSISYIVPGDDPSTPRTSVSDGTVEVNGDTEHNISLAGMVKVTGHITLNDEPVPSARLYVAFESTGEPGGAGGGITINPDGTYSCLLTPGTYKVRGTSNDGLPRRWPQIYTIEATDEQTIDIHLVTVPVDVIIDVPEGEEFEPGLLVVTSTADSTEASQVTMTTATNRLQDIVPGTYRASLSRKDDLVAKSKDTEIGPGLENVIVVGEESGPTKRWRLTVTLPPGDYNYKFMTPPADWMLDRANPRVTQDNYRNSAFSIPQKPMEDGTIPPAPLVNDATGQVTFEAQTASDVKEIYVCGPFNNWQATAEYKMMEVQDQP